MGIIISRTAASQPQQTPEAHRKQIDTLTKEKQTLDSENKTLKQKIDQLGDIVKKLEAALTQPEKTIEKRDFGGRVAEASQHILAMYKLGENEKLQEEIDDMQAELDELANVIFSTEEMAKFKLEKTKILGKMGNNIAEGQHQTKLIRQKTQTTQINTERDIATQREDHDQRRFTEALQSQEELEEAKRAKEKEDALIEFERTKRGHLLASMQDTMNN